MRTKRKNRLVFGILVAIILGLSSPAWAVLQAVGPAAPAGTPADPPTYPAVAPHGFPGFYEDLNGLQLELCLDPVDPVTLTGPCIMDPVIAGNAWSETAGFGAEAFFMVAQADSRPLVVGGKALLVIGVEAAYSADGTPVPGNQTTFGRVRVRFHAPNPAHYRVTHPYGVIDLPLNFVAESLAVHRDVRITIDTGAINPVNPAAAFAGALKAFGDTQAAFLTWDTFNADPALTDPALVVNDPLTGAATARYIGDAATPHLITGSPTGNNLFRIEVQDATTGGWRIVSETNLFVVAGKVHVPPAAYNIFTYTNLPVPNLWDLGPRSNLPPVSAVGPVNRAANWPLPGSNLPTPGAPADPGDPLAVPPVPATPAVPPGDGYPIGFPFWYQERVPAIDPATGQQATDPVTGNPVFQGGFQLTVCPSGDPMCISAPVDRGNPASVALNVGDESFYWSADSDINFRTNLPVARRIDGKLIMAMEAAFSNPLGQVTDGDQAVFARIRVRIRVDQPGRYRVLHPYGEYVFNVTDPRELINFTEDIGILMPGTNPDAGMVGALYGKINPFLRWTTFNPDPALTDPALKKTVTATGDTVMYLGSPLIRHLVVGSPIPDAIHPSGFRNYFRIISDNGIDAVNYLFAVTGKLFGLPVIPATPTTPEVPPTPPPAPVPPNPQSPVAVADTFTIPGGQPAALGVLANDTVTNGPAVVSVVVAPLDGTATVNPDGTVTYSPLSLIGSVDNFTYQITDATGLVSGIATVTVTRPTLPPAETITVDRAQLTLNRREWSVQGTSSAPGSTLTVIAGPDAAGAVVGSVTVDTAGRWKLRSRALTNPAATSVTIRSSTGAVLLNQPLTVR